MITLRKLASLAPGTRRRKMVRLLREMEHSRGWQDPTGRRYLAGICRLMADDPDLSAELRADAEERGQFWLMSREAAAGDSLRKCHDLRHRLMAVTGEFSLEGDQEYFPAVEGRQILPVDIFLEDIRSPYNVGALFRTSECLGARQLYVSPHSASPGHRRALRASMGTLERMRWEEKSFSSLPPIPLVAMETGGAPLENFVFPEQGILAAGSEELGLSPDVLERARREGGVVSIPMMGQKASLNVSVAFGIVLNRWVEQLQKKARSAGADRA